MKIIKPSYEILNAPSRSDVYRVIELAARNCYKSEEKIAGEESTARFLASKVALGHESVIEHMGFSVRFICDRGISHELVRHRLFSFSQESTRYANYSKDKFGNEITVICPSFWESDTTKYARWYRSMQRVEYDYMELLSMGAKPQEARSVLPTCLKTDVIGTANMREWRHTFKLRTGKAAHPQIRELMIPLMYEVAEMYPALFDDVVKKYEEENNA